MEDIVRQRFARPVRKELSPKTPQRVRKGPAGGFQVTLKTYLVLPFRREPRRIHDRATDLNQGPAGRGLLYVRASRAVTALAIDPFRNSAAQSKFGSSGYPQFG